jgi:Ser/Thr protein kinase RdoA (MazF antagonist)
MIKTFANKKSFTLLTIQPDVQVLAETYNLSQPIQTAELDDRVYRIITPEQEYALKVYRRETRLEQQRYVHWILTSLRNLPLTFSLPFPVRSQRGGTFHMAANGDVWVLAPLLAGEKIQPNDPDHAYAVGAALSELHVALAQIQPITPPGWGDYTPQQRILPHLLGAMPAEPADLGLQDTPESQHRLKRFLRLAKTFLEEPPPPSWDIHWHVIHGDFFARNLLYDGEQITGVLDFKGAHPDYRAREVAQTLMTVASDLGALFWGIARSFLEGYIQYLRLTRAEIDMIPRFVVESQVDHILAYTQSGQRAHAARALRSQEEISAWLEVEQPRLLAMMRGVFLGE